MQKTEKWKPLPLPEQSEKISVIVAVFRVERYLEKCVKSIQAQTYRNLEIILVDDGSDDGCPALCDRLAAEDERITVIHKTNGGLSDARNAGTAAAAGKYIAYVDGDDWIEPEMYEQMLSAMLEWKAPICACNYKRIYRNRTEDAGDGSLTVFDGSEMLECFLAEEEGIQIQNAAWNKLYERTLIEEGEPLRFPRGRLYEDIVYTTKLLARAESGVYVNRTFYNYVVEREDSIMNQISGEKIFTHQIPAYEEKEQFLRSIGREDLAWEHRYFFYMRLLQYYSEWIKNPKEKRWCEEIRFRIQEGKADFWNIYSVPAAKSIEKKKAEIFAVSPILYRAFVFGLEKIVFPLLAALRRH